MRSRETIGMSISLFPAWCRRQLLSRQQRRPRRRRRRKVQQRRTDLGRRSRNQILGEHERRVCSEGAEWSGQRRREMRPLRPHGEVRREDRQMAEYQQSVSRRRDGWRSPRKSQHGNCVGIPCRLVRRWRAVPRRWGYVAGDSGWRRRPGRASADARGRNGAPVRPAEACVPSRHRRSARGRPRSGRTRRVRSAPSAVREIRSMALPRPCRNSLSASRYRRPPSTACRSPSSPSRRG